MAADAADEVIGNRGKKAHPLGATRLLPTTMKGVMLIPFLGWGRLLHTVSTRMHKPGFALRLNLEGAALVALSALAMYLQQTLTGWARAAC